MRLAPTLLSVLLAAVTLAPAPGRIDVLRLVASADASTTYAAVATLPTPELTRRLALLVGDLFRVPPPASLVLYRYPDPLAFARGLVDHGGVDAVVAMEFARSAIGVAGPGSIYLLADGRDDDRVRLVIHELTHVVQHELAGSVARPPQWMMEGSAEWAALTLLSRLGAANAAHRASAARAAADRYLGVDAGFTPAGIRRSADFRRWQRDIGDRLAYHVAYALVDRLAGRHGVAALVTYFRAFRSSDDAERHFQRAFGTSTAAFADGVRAALRVGAAPHRS